MCLSILSRRVLEITLCVSTFVFYTQAQSCYWPDGSIVGPGQGFYAPCTPLGGPCCREGEVCLSNGLCYGGTFGVPYRGACTNPDWSDCVDLGNDIDRDRWSNLWMCGAPNNSLGGPWWVGDSNLVTPCESGKGATFTTWPSAKIGKVIQQTKALSSSGSTTAAATTSVVDATSIALSTTKTSAAATNQPSQPSGGASRLPIALGAGIGIPLGVAALGFIAFLFWKVRQHKILHRESTNANRPYVTQNAPNWEGFGEGRMGELGADDTRREMWAENPKRYHEIDTREHS